MKYKVLVYKNHKKLEKELNEFTKDKFVGLVDFGYDEKNQKYIVFIEYENIITNSGPNTNFG